MNRKSSTLSSRVACMAAACLALAGAGAHAADPTVDPCALVTKAEVEQIIGKLKAAPKPGRNDRLLTCEYQFADGSHELLLWVMPAAAMQRARKQFNDLQPVNGLGEEAFTHHDETFDYTVVYFRKGDSVVEIGVPAAAKDGASQVKALAAKAASRL